MSWREKEQINRAYLSLGSNLGNKLENIQNAIDLLSERAGEVVLVSSNYETEPEGFITENSFVNIALCIDTRFSELELLDICEKIEKDLGRETKSVNLNYSDRVIDIDILYFNNIQLATDKLTLPHPRMHKRKFVLEPLAEIAPKLRHPILGMNTKQMLVELGIRNSACKRIQTNKRRVDERSDVLMSIANNNKQINASAEINYEAIK